MPWRRRISLQQHEWLVRDFEDEHEDCLAVADTIGVNRSTARGIVARYVREGRIAEKPRGGQNSVCIDEGMKENYILTLSQINQELRQCLPNKPDIHNRTVSKTLQGMLCRVKLARPSPAERNRPDVIHKPYDYASWFFRHAVVNHFIDECGYNIWTSRSQGKARIGDRAYRYVCWQRGRNVTVALVISPTNGLVFHSAFIDGMITQKFSDVFVQTRLNLDPDRKTSYFYKIVHLPNTAPPIQGKIQNSTL